MSLSIVAAKDLEQACAVLSARPGKAMRARTAEEPEAVGNFLYDFRAAFTNYETYYRFDPYRETLLGPDQVLAIRAFADSVVTLLSEHEAEENPRHRDIRRVFFQDPALCGGAAPGL